MYSQREVSPRSMLDLPARRLSHRVLASTVALGLAVLPLSAQAAPPEASDAGTSPGTNPGTEPDDAAIDTQDRAMTAYRAGEEAYERGEYEDALGFFLEAQSLFPSPVFHYNIARCYEALDNLEQAIISYQAYLRSHASAYGEDPDDKINIENKIERLQQTVETRAALAEQEQQQLRDAAAAKPVIIQAPQDDRPPGRGLIITGGVLTGVGVAAAAIGGTVFGLRARDLNDQVAQVVDGTNPERVTLEQARQLDIDGRSAQTGQIVVLSVGSAIAVTGIALLATGIVKRKRGKGGASARLRPSFGPQGGGLILEGRF